MRILLINQYFYPDMAATAQLMTDLAVDLAARGAEVTVVTSRASYVGGPRYPSRGITSGVRILRVPSTSMGRSSIPRRMADYLSFYTMCTAQIAALPRQDVCITLSTPPLLSMLGGVAKLASLARTKFVYWVQDLYPDLAVSLGLLREGALVTRTLELISRASVRAADAVVVLENEMARRLIAKGARPNKLHVIPNWSDGAEIGQVTSQDNWFLDQHGLRGKFVVLYSGNMGKGHEFGTVLGAARELYSREDIVFLFVGDGAKRMEVADFAASHPNVRLLPYQRREDLPYSLAAGDACVITLSDGLEGMIVPSKLYGILAARRPVLYIGPPNGEVGRVVQRELCGGSFAHGDVRGVVDFVLRLAAQPLESSAMGERGRYAFDRYYTRRSATDRFAKLCEELRA